MTLKQKLRHRQRTVGSWLSFDYHATTEFLARAGFEWLVIDLEHTATSVAGMCRLLQVIELAGCTPLVRVGANDPLLIKLAMDSGSHGVIVPMVNSRAEAERAAAALHYPPAGNRGVGLWRAQRYGTGFDAYREWAAKESVLIVQIEHWRAVDALEDILAVEAVDGFIVGPYDLSGSLGCPGDFANPRFRECLAKIEAVAQAHAKSAGYHLVHPDPAGARLAETLAAGYNFIAYGTDMIFFTKAVTAETERLRASGLLGH